MIVLYLVGTSDHTHEYVTSLLKISHIFVATFLPHTVNCTRFCF